jgi:uncharacterized tellurite resistance protein B-like protein
MTMPNFKWHIKIRKGTITRQGRRSIKDVKNIFNGDGKKDSLESAVINKIKKIMELKKGHYYQ